jgi:predicted RNase H-like HicB family nuclease
MSEFYVAIIERNSEGRIFATVPDLPGVNAMADNEHDVLTLAVELANDFVEDYVDLDHEFRSPRSYEEVLAAEPRGQNELTRALIPVEVPGKSVKVSLSIDEALLARLDKAAEGVGETRSGYVAGSVLRRMRQETKDTPLGLLRALEGVSLRDAVQAAMANKDKE